MHRFLILLLSLVVCSPALASPVDDARAVRKAFVEAENAGSLDEIRGLLHEDVIYALPGEAPMFGRDAAMQLFTVLAERFEYSTSYELEQVDFTGDRLVEHGTVTMTYRPRGGGDGETISVPCALETVSTEAGWQIDVLLLGTVGPVAELVPRLPAPTGPHAVGVRSAILVDDARPDPFFPDQPRSVGIEMWYPAEVQPEAVPRTYASEEVVRALTTFLDQPVAPWLFMTHARTHSVEDPPPLPGSRPVVLYNHGYSGFTGVHQALCEDLASHGYVVVSVGHAHESALFVEPGGKCRPFDRDAYPHRSRMDEAALAAPEAAKDRILRARNVDDRHAAYEDLLELSPLHQESARIWAEDCRFVLDQLERMDGDPTFDLGRVGAIGHSLGGATAGQLAVVEPRIGAIVNLDGFQFGDLLDHPLEVPSMFMGAQRAWAGESTISNDVFFHEALAPSWTVLISGFEHASFTDLCLFGMAPGIGEGPDAGAEAVRIQREYVRAFFDQALRGIDSDRLDPKAEHHPAVQLRFRD